MIKDNHFGNTACIDGKFNVATYREVAAYDPKEGRWEWDLGLGPISTHMHSDSYCEIGNVLYSAADGPLRWYDSQVRQWRDLTGLVGLSRLRPDDHVRLADYDGKMAVMWGVEVPYGRGYPTIICCAVISLERLSTLQHNLARIQGDAMLEHYESELEINDLPQNARWKVTHKETLGPISEWSGAAITVRGQFYPSGSIPRHGERKLYLFVEGPTENSVKTAIAEIKHVLEDITNQGLSLPGGAQARRYSVL